MTALLDRLVEAGFSDWETGGRCKAWGWKKTLKGHEVEITVTDLDLTLEMKHGPFTVMYEIDPRIEPRKGQRYFRFVKFADAVSCAVAMSRACEIDEES